MAKSRSTILLMDGSAAERAFLRRCLEQDETYDYDILEAATEQAGLRLCQQRHPEVVLLSDDWPEASGFELLGQLASYSETSGGAVILLLEQADRAAAAQGMERGARDYLFKAELTADLLCRVVRHRIEMGRVQQQLAQQQEALDHQRQIQKSLEEGKFCLHLIKTITSDRTPDLTAAQVIDRVVSQIHAFYGDLRIHYCVIDRNDHLQIQHSLQPPALTDCTGLEFDLGQAPAYLATLRAHQILVAPDILQESKLAPLTEALQQINIRAMLALPLQHSETEVGLLSLTGDQCRDWSAREVQALTEIANFLAFALRGATAREQQRLVETALRQSEARNRAMLVALPDLLLRVKRDGTCLDFMPPRTLQRGNFVPIQAHLSEVLLPDLLQHEFDRMDQALVTGELQVWEHQLLRSNGRLGYEEVRLVHYQDDEFLVIVRDITDRKQAETQIQQSEEQLQLTLEFTGIGAWSWHPVTGEYRWNGQMEELLELPPGLDNLFQSWCDRIHPEDVDRVQTSIQQALDSCNTFTEEYRYQLLDGRMAWRWVKGQAIYTETGEVERVLGVVQDIDDRKQAEAVLRENEERFRQLAEHIRDAFFICTPELDHFFYVSPGVERIWGIPAETLYQSPRSWLERVHPDDWDYVLENTPLDRMEFDYDLEYRILRPDGEMRWVHVRSYTVTNDQNRVDRLVGVCEDITERKKSEGSLQRTNQLLAAISQAQSQFIKDEDSGALFDNLLETLLQLTHSEYGFIGEILHNSKGEAYIDESFMKMRGQPYLKAKAITDIAWNQETKVLYEIQALQGMEFHNLRTLFGQVIVTGQPVISNSPSTDPRQGGLPAGHPPLKAFMGIPFFRGKHLVGLVGIANCPEGYTPAIIAELEPFLSTCASTIEAYRNNTRRQQAELALKESQAVQQAIIQALPDLLIRMEVGGHYRELISSQYMKVLLPTKPIQESTVYDVLPGPVADQRLHYIQLALETGQLQRYEQTLEIEGQLCYEEVRVVPLLNQEVLAIVRDVTDRKQAELALQQLNEELELRVEQRNQKLIQSERDLRTIFNNVYDSILIHDLDGTILDANDRALELRGVTREQLIGASILDLFAPDVPLDRMDDILQRVQAGETMRFEWREKRFRDQTIFDIEVSLRQVVLGNRSVFIAGVRDISDRKQAQQALQQSEERFRQIAETIQEAFWMTTLDSSEVLYISPVFEQIWGISCEAVYASPGLWFEVVHPDDQAGLRWVFERLAVERCDVTYRIIRPDGELRWIRDRAFPIRDKTGQVYRIAGVAEDITQRKQAEAALRDSEERFRVTFDQAAVGMVQANLQGKFVRMNQKFCDIVGHNEAYLQQHSFREITHPDDIEKDTLEVGRLMTGEASTFHMEKRYIRQDGAIVWANLSVSLVRDAAGEPQYFIGVIQDINERVRLEAERKRTEAALQQLNLKLEQRVQERTLELQKMMEAAAAANLAKSTFLANMSHELRTPLNAILGFAQLLSRDLTIAPDRRQKLNIINSSGKHLLNLINSILEMSKIEAGRISFTPTCFDLDDLFNTLEGMFNLRAVEKGLQFFIDRVSPLPRFIETDDNKLRQVLINLISNAIKFAASGHVILRVRQVPGETPSDRALLLQFEVEDTGPGIDASEVESLFEPFIQSSNRQITQEGTGLGLPISRQFVQLMGGTLTVQSRLGVGSTFAFTIPVQTADLSRATACPDPRHILGLAPNQPPCRVLVVEDDESNRLLLVQLLRSVGFEVQSAINGQEAVDLWQSWRPQLVCMDLRMPVMNGYEATQRIREQEQQRATPTPTVIIALTANAFEEDRAGVLAAGCNDFIRKPFQETELLEKMADKLGLRLLYDAAEDLDRSAATVLHQADAIAALQTLPSTWLEHSRQSTIQLNSQEMAHSIEQITPTHPDLAALLMEKLNNFDFEQILQLLEAALLNR